MSLQSPRRVGAGRFIARCPAHDDKSPSLSITQAGNHVLFYCHAGCTQSELIDIFRGNGLWQPVRSQKRYFSDDELDFMLHFCLVWNSSIRRGKDVSERDTEKMSSYVRVLSEFDKRRYTIVEDDAYGR